MGNRGRGRIGTMAVVAVLTGALLPASGWAGAGQLPATPLGDGDRVVLAVHGGAGTRVPPELERDYRKALRTALESGFRTLRSGGSSLDGVEAAVRVLENSELFNAGKGAVFNTDAQHELDASVMTGDGLRGAGVAGVRHVRNPVSLARLVLERSPHVLMAGEGAEMFARQQGVPTVPQDYFFTDRRWQQLREAKRTDPNREKLQFGTVGAVAADGTGDLAAATSTGGMTNKLAGRIGDSPLLGAGTYAKNDVVAVSSTGSGESFIRTAAAHTVSALMEYRGLPVGDAARQVVQRDVPGAGGQGGVIALDDDGVLAAPYSSPSLIYGYVTAAGRYVLRPTG